MKPELVTSTNLIEVLDFMKILMDSRLSTGEFIGHCNTVPSVFIMDLNKSDVVHYFDYTDLNSHKSYLDRTLFSYGRFGTYRTFPGTFTHNGSIGVRLGNNRNTTSLDLSKYKNIDIKPFVQDEVDWLFVQYCMDLSVETSFEMCIVSFLDTCYNTQIQGDFRANTHNILTDEVMHFIREYNKQHKV